MELNSPVCISPRLLPGLPVGKPSEDTAWISIKYAENQDDPTRVRYQWFIDFKTRHFTSDEMQSAAMKDARNLQYGLQMLLECLAQCGESYTLNPTGESATVFPKHIAKWASENESELTILANILQEHKGLIKEKSNG